MRPNIDISHRLDGAVKDLAEKWDVTTTEAYRRVIQAGVDAHGRGGEQTKDDRHARARDVDDDIAALDLPGTGSLLDERRDAVRACYDYLRERGQARRKDFLEDVRPDHPAQYGSDRAWWKAVGAGLRELGDRRDDLDRPGEGQDDYRFVG